VSDIAQEGAFDTVSCPYLHRRHATEASGEVQLTRYILRQQAVQSEPPFDYVIHTASPFYHTFDDPVKDILDPAIIGTTGILRAIKKFGPNVKRVVVTSSFAAIVNQTAHPKVYDETSWNQLTKEEAVADRSQTYRASKVRTRVQMRTRDFPN
jgi:nucleoside-diphosphate-sugar epimerase